MSEETNTPLARRYRRLLACYPAHHRRDYEEEMLGVLLAGARPGQRYPGARESADLLLSATAARLRHRGTGFVDPLWMDAVAVLATIGAVLILADLSRTVFGDLVWLVRFGDAYPFLDTGMVARWLVWTALVVALLTRRVRLTRMAARAVLVVQIGLWIPWRSTIFSTDLPWVPHSVTPGIPLLVAGALLMVRGAARRGPVPLRRRGLVVLGVAGLLTAITPAIEPLLWKMVVDPETNEPALYYIGSDVSVLLLWSTYLVVAILVMVAVWGVARPLRRRLFTLLASLGTAAFVTQFGMERRHYDVSALLSPHYWNLNRIVLVMLPPLVFVVGRWLTRRLDGPVGSAGTGATDGDG